MAAFLLAKSLRNGRSGGSLSSLLTLSRRFSQSGTPALSSSLASSDSSSSTFQTTLDAEASTPLQPRKSHGIYRVNTAAALGHVTRHEPSAAALRVGMLRNGQLIDVMETYTGADNSLWFKFHPRGMPQPIWSLAEKGTAKFFTETELTTLSDVGRQVLEADSMLMSTDSLHRTLLAVDRQGGKEMGDPDTVDADQATRTARPTRQQLERSAPLFPKDGLSEGQDALDALTRSVDMWAQPTLGDLTLPPAVDGGADSGMGVAGADMTQDANAPVVTEVPVLEDAVSDDVLGRMTGRHIVNLISYHSGVDFLPLRQQLIAAGALAAECEVGGTAVKEYVLAAPEVRLLVDSLAANVPVMSTDDLAILANNLERMRMFVKAPKEFSVEEYKQRASLQQDARERMLTVDSVQTLLTALVCEMAAREDMMTKHAACAVWAAIVWEKIPVNALLDKALALMAVQVEPLPFLVLQRLVDSCASIQGVVVSDAIKEQIATMALRHMERGAIPAPEFVRMVKPLVIVCGTPRLLPLLSHFANALMPHLPQLSAGRLMQLLEGLSHGKLTRDVIPSSDEFFAHLLQTLAVRSAELTGPQMAVAVSCLQRLGMSIPTETMARLDPVSHVSNMMRTSGVLKVGGSGGQRERILSQAGEFIFQKVTAFPSAAAGRKMQMDNLKLTHVRPGEESTRQRILKKQTDLKASAERKAAELRALDCIVSCVEILQRAPNGAQPEHITARSVLANKSRVFYRNNMMSVDAGWEMMPFLFKEVIEGLVSQSDNTSAVAIMNTLEKHGMALDLPSHTLDALRDVHVAGKVRYGGLPSFNAADLQARAKRVHLEVECTRDAASQYRVTTLRACLKRLGQPAQGKKNELVDRLIAHPAFTMAMLDQEHEAEAEEAAAKGAKKSSEAAM